MTARKTVELFYDVVSPYSWLGFEVMCRYRTRWNIDLKLKPFFLGGIMQGADNKPPALVPNRAAYMVKDLQRAAKYFKLPLNQPADPADVMFVKGSLTAQRLLTAVDMNYPEFLEPLSRQLWMRIWSRDEDITTPASFIEASKLAGLNDDQIKTAVGLIKDQKVKDRLKQYTDEALSYRAFGSPTMVAHVDGKAELVFGSDRFPILAQILGEKWDGPAPDQDRSKL